MPSPAPPIPLTDHCSVIHNDTLYTYSHEAFQSIPIAEDGQWTERPVDVSIRGGACVKVIPNGDESQAAMYVVGGSTNATDIESPGLRRYRFADEAWEAVTPVDKVTQNRRNHGAVYLNASSSILIYAGSQDTADPSPSSQTFLLSTIPPYEVRSYSSAAPPLVRPLLLPWNASHAVMVGGDEANRQVFTFSPEAGWINLGVTLEEGLPDDSQVQAVLVDGDDGSKVLHTFDVSKAPNTVNRIVLQNGSGQGPAPGQTLRRRSSHPPPSKRRKRDLTVADWPTYDASQAPNNTRTDFSLAQSPDGLVVMSGGSGEDALTVFDVRNSQWVDPSSLWSSDATLVDAAGTTPSASSTPDSSSTALPSSPFSPAETSATAAALSADSARERALIILGATLGTIFGVALLVVGILVWLRCHKRARFDESGRQRRASGLPSDDEKDRLSFADRGASFMSQAGGYLGHAPKESFNSSSSRAIMAGHGSERYKNGPFPAHRQSTASSLFSRVRKRPLIAEEGSRLSRLEVDEKRVSSFPGHVPAGATAAGTTATPTATSKEANPVGLSRQRSSGWSRYFLGDAQTDSGRGGRERTPSPTDPSGLQVPEPVRIVNVGRSPSGRNRNGTGVVVTTTATAMVLKAEEAGQVATIVGPEDSGGGSLYIQSLESSTTSSPRATDNEGMFFSHDEMDLRHHEHQQPPPERDDGSGEQLGWSPVGRRESEWSSGRAGSSIYTDSAHGSLMPPREVSASAFPRVPRESTATVFPGVGGGGGGGSGLGVGGEDMSWLNLGGSRERVDE